MLSSCFIHCMSFIPTCLSFARIATLSRPIPPRMVPRFANSCTRLCTAINNRAWPRPACRQAHGRSSTGMGRSRNSITYLTGSGRCNWGQRVLRCSLAIPYAYPPLRRIAFGIRASQPCDFCAVARRHIVMTIPSYWQSKTK